MKIDRKAILLGTSALCGLLLSGCAGSGSSNPTVAGAKSAVQVRMGDAALDNVLALELTVNSVTLTDASGANVSVLSSPTEIELTHVAGVFEPLVLNSVPQGAYTKATVTVSAPDITYIDAATGQIVEKHPTLASSTAVVSFPGGSASIGSGSNSLNFDFSVPHSVTIDSSSNVTITPTFVASIVNIPSTDQDTESGETEDIEGVVVSNNGQSLVISPEESGGKLTFATDGNTSYQGVSSLNGISVGELVQIDAITQADGSFLASEIELQDAQNNSLEAEGLVTSVVGSPAATFNVLVQDEASASPASSQPALGSQMTVSATPSTVYKINHEHVSLDNLPFVPVFSGSTIAPVQRVEAVADLANATALVAQEVELQQQTLSGQVSNYQLGSNGQASFTMTVGSGSVFAHLAGQTTITVYQQTKTKLQDMTSIANGDSVCVRGLLLLDGTQYRLVASHIMKP